MNLDETEDSKHLRTVVGAEIQAVMDKHEVGGVVMLCSRESAAWITVFPTWSGLQADPVHGMRVRLNSKVPNAQELADSTIGLIANLRDMCSGYGSIFRQLFEQVVEAFAKQGTTVEHVPLSVRQRRPNPMASIEERFAAQRVKSPAPLSGAHLRAPEAPAERTHCAASAEPAVYDTGTQRLIDDLLAKPQSFDRDEIIRRAKKLKYHSYKSDDAMCSVTLVKHLGAAGFKDLAKLAAEDRYEQDAEESRRWAEETEEGRELTAIVDADPALGQKLTDVLEAMGKVAKDMNVDAAVDELTRQGVTEKTPKD